jgi:hypothetical protein
MRRIARLHTYVGRGICKEQAESCALEFQQKTNVEKHLEIKEGKSPYG